jgi:4-amino-4-deoxy-L-arabinose transferase-like glycosyltransferase
VSLVADRLWSQQAVRNWPILLAAAVPMLLALDRGELWTLEGRWALICEQMQRNGDGLHPELFGEPYFGKPLISYWLMVLCGLPVGGVGEGSLRLPSALAGVLAVWCTIRVGTAWFDRRTGRVAGCVLATCFCFVFWARVASADMLHTAGTIAAVAWYTAHRERDDWRAWCGLGLLLAVASLCKTPAAAVMAMLVIAPDLWRRSRRQPRLLLHLLAGFLPGIAVFALQVLLVRGTDTAGQAVGGLGTLWHESLERFFAPYDHGAPPYIYLYHLPLFLLPWSLGLPWLLTQRCRWWRQLSPASWQALWATAALFLFLTACGTRRSYYILPVLPFAALMIADWLANTGDTVKRLRIAGRVALLLWLSLVSWFGIAVPWLATQPGNRRAFAKSVRAVAARSAPWESWEVLVCNAVPSAVWDLHAVRPAHGLAIDEISSLDRRLQSQPHTVVLSRRSHLSALRQSMPAATVVEQAPRTPGWAPAWALLWLQGSDQDLLVALVP